MSQPPTCRELLGELYNNGSWPWLHANGSWPWLHANGSWPWLHANDFAARVERVLALHVAGGGWACEQCMTHLPCKTQRLLDGDEP